MLLIHLLGWAAAGAFASPVAAPSEPSSIHLPPLPSQLPSGPPSVALPSPSKFVIASPTPTKALDGNCTSTMLRNVFTGYNPSTRTVHLSTVTSTSSVDCDGCLYLDVINIGGLGPVVQSNETTTDSSPATVINFACIV